MAESINTSTEFTSNTTIMNTNAVPNKYMIDRPNAIKYPEIKWFNSAVAVPAPTLPKRSHTQNMLSALMRSTTDSTSNARSYNYTLYIYPEPTIDALANNSN